MDLIIAVGWESLIIPLIALGIFIFSSLFGEKKGAKVKSPLGPANRNPVSDIDRFFEEAKSRRAKQAFNAEAVQVGQPFGKFKPAEPKVKKQLPKKPPVNKNLHPEMAFSDSKVPSNERSLANPGANSLDGEPHKFLRDLDVTPHSPETISGIAGRTFSSKTSPMIKEALALLKGPKVLGSAFVIQEILSLPLCMRPRQIR